MMMRILVVGKQSSVVLFLTQIFRYLLTYNWWCRNICWLASLAAEFPEKHYLFLCVIPGKTVSFRLFLTCSFAELQ